jgi:hypothetical protein
MLLQRRRIWSKSPGNTYRLQNESSGKSLFGFCHEGSLVKLGDEEKGSNWSGNAVEDGSGGYLYRFTDQRGQTMTGMSDGSTILMRDSSGRTWKGFVD